jgi:hypothetical protein
MLRFHFSELGCDSWPFPCSIPALLSVKRRPLPTIKCRPTTLLDNAEAESILRGVMYAWSAAVRSLNIGVNSWCDSIKKYAEGCCQGDAWIESG